jgi:MFS family permease
VMRRFGFRTVLVWNAVVGAAIIALCIPLTPATPLYVVIVLLLIAGFSQALEVIGMNALAYSDIESNQMSAATGLAQVVNQLGMAIGVVIATVTLHLAESAAGRTQLAPLDFKLAFVVSAVILLAGAPFYYNLAADSGAEVSGHRGRRAANPELSDAARIRALAESQREGEAGSD